MHNTLQYLLNMLFLLSKFICPKEHINQKKGKELEATVFVKECLALQGEGS